MQLSDAEVPCCLAAPKSERAWGAHKRTGLLTTLNLSISRVSISASHMNSSCVLQTALRSHIRLLERPPAALLWVAARAWQTIQSPCSPWNLTGGKGCFVPTTQKFWTPKSAGLFHMYIGNVVFGNIMYLFIYLSIYLYIFSFTFISIFMFIFIFTDIYSIFIFTIYNFIYSEP